MSIPGDTEREAACALAGGDLRGTLAVLMEGYGDALYRHCRQMVGRADWADEAHQAVFVQAFRDLARFEARSTFRGWLFGIARHRCLDVIKVHRRWYRRFVPLAPAEAPEPAAASDLADEQLAVHACARRLEACLQRLAPAIRQAVLLRFQEGLTYEQMAPICGERPATLQARVSRALPKLRQWLREEGIDHER